MRRGVVFRMAPDSSAPVHTTGELEERLRRRLRIISMILALAMGTLALLTIVLRFPSVRANPSLIWTDPPLPGVLLVVSAIAGVLVVALSPRRTLGLARLRVIEWFGVALTALFFVINQTRALGVLAPEFRDAPMEIGVAQGAPWGILILAYGVLIPSHVRHSAIRTAIVALCAFIPDLVVLPGTLLPGSPVGPYLSLKVFIILVMSALAIYGAYRIDALGQQAEVARELGQYLLRRSLGEGGMGSVFLAEHRFLRRPCAVKLIRADQATDEVALARFEREVQSAAGLTHPNTVQIYDYGRSDDGTFYFAMEFLPGISLEALVERHGPLEPARAVHVLTQLCGALNEAHQRGLVHRDLKPANVMLCERGGVPDVAKLLDFGLVTPVEPTEADTKITQAGMIMGTPAYMSPEQCLGDSNITPASDIYSLGALGHFLLTGKPPFAGRNAMQTLVAHARETPRPVRESVPTVPETLDAVIARCLAKSPEDRFATVAELGDALMHAIDTPWTLESARSWWRAQGAAIS